MENVTFKKLQELVSEDMAKMKDLIVRQACSAVLLNYSEEFDKIMKGIDTRAGLGYFDYQTKKQISQPVRRVLGELGFSVFNENNIVFVSW